MAKYKGKLWIVMAILVLVTIARGGQTNDLYCLLNDQWIEGYYAGSAMVDTTLRTGYDNAGTLLRSFLKFDLRAFKSAGVKSATLRLHKINDSVGNASYMTIHRVTNDWTYGQCSYNNRKTGVAWVTLGGDLDLSTNYGGSVVSGASPLGWYEIDITDLARKWADGSYDNYGMAFSHSGGGWTGPKFDSSRATDQSFIPELRVEPRTPVAEDWTVLTPEADLFYDEYYDWICWSTETYLKAQRNNANAAARSLIRFDISGFRPGGTLLSATLMLYKYNLEPRSNPTYLYRVTNSWVNGQATWASRSSGVSWSTAGGDYDPVPIALGGSLPYANSPTNWYAFDVTEWMEDWINGTSVNNGILIINDAGGNQGPRFYSSDYTDAVYRPYLEVEYHLPGGTLIIIK